MASFLARGALVGVLAAGAVLLGVSPASACTGTSLCSAAPGGANAFVLEELAVTSGGGAVATLEGSVLTGSVAQVPTAVAAADMGFMQGLRLVGGGVYKIALRLGGAAGFLLGADTSVGARPLGEGLPVEAGGGSGGWTQGTTLVRSLTYGDLPSANATDTLTIGAVSVSGSSVSYSWDRSFTGGGYDITFPYTYCRAAGTPPGSLSAIAAGGLRVGSASGTGVQSGTRTVDCGAGEMVDSLKNSLNGNANSGHDDSMGGTDWGVTPMSPSFWYPEGDPRRPGDVAAEATQVVTSSVRCQAPDGTITAIAGSSQVFTLSQLAAGATVAVPEVLCPDNSFAAGGSVGVDTTTTTGGTTSTSLSDAESAPSTATAGRATGLLDGTDTGLTLWFGNGSSATSCEESGTACQGWAANPERTTKFECRDNGVVVPISRCAILAPWYTPVAPKEVGNPDTGGKGLPDPKDDPDGCFPTGYGLANPISWVMMPVKCALTWAFVPKQSLQTSLSPVRVALDGTAIGQIGDWFAGIDLSGWVPSAGGCGVIVDVRLDVLQREPFVVSTCGGFWQDVSILRTLSGIAFEAASVLLGVRMILKTVRIDSEVI